MTEYGVNLKSFRLTKRPHLSPARMLAHAARAERNAAEYERLCRIESVDSDVVVVTIRQYVPAVYAWRIRA